MATLTLCEVNQSQLDTTPIINGQLLVCLDTGNMYRDTDGSRVRTSSDLEIVNSLPLAPLANKIYLLLPSDLYVCSGGEWIKLNNPAIMTGSTEGSDGASGLVPAPSAGNVERYLRADGTWDTPESGASIVIREW